MNNGTLFVISGPSGCGKGTVCKELLKRNPYLRLSVSATTRQIGPGEIDGISYFFKTKEEFEEMIEADMLLEYVQGYSGKYYGTPKEYVFGQLEKGNDVILEIEMNGAASVKEKFPESILIFLVPPDKDELKRRLVTRGREDANKIAERLSKVDYELNQAYKYKYVVINDKLDDCVSRIEAIITAEKCLENKNREFINELINS